MTSTADRSRTVARRDRGDLFPLLLLAIVPAGRTTGLDGHLATRFSGRRPF